jgi:hypothetical protein
MNLRKKYRQVLLLTAAASLVTKATASTDIVTEWNTKAVQIVAAAKFPAPAAFRVMAIVQSAVYEAVNAITRRYPSERTTLDAASETSIEAAVAAANRGTLLPLAQSQQATIESTYRAALLAIPDGKPKAEGIALGEKAAAAILALRADDGAATHEAYRPGTAAGVYVPTAVPLVPQWPHRKPWIMTSADQFRPGPPPRLTSKEWARDFNEIKTIGSKNSTQRSSEQTAIAKFWEATGPIISFPVVRSIATMQDRELTRNARLLAVAAQALDDALIAVFDAKYHYGFWRPITAIRNGDMDGNDATERDSAWEPFIDTPMHPEYPCAHCISAATVSAILQAEVGAQPMPKFSTTSPSAPGVVRTWTSTSDFIKEVENARVYDGVHYRNSTEVGSARGTKIGELAVLKYLRSPK